MMMNEEYTKGREIGEILGAQKAMNDMLASHIEEQKIWNLGMEKRMSIAEQWIQTTTGKVIVLTTILGVVGSLFYIAVNWLISHFK